MILPGNPSSLMKQNWCDLPMVAGGRALFLFPLSSAHSSVYVPWWPIFKKYEPRSDYFLWSRQIGVHTVYELLENFLKKKKSMMAQWFQGGGSQVKASFEALSCVLVQDTLSSA